MIYILLIAFLIGFELQQLFQFNFFFRMYCLIIDYPTKIFKRVNSVAYKETIKLTFADLAYTIILAAGLFSTTTVYFFCGILFLSFIRSAIFKIVKNKTIRKILYIIDILLSLSLLTLSIINLIFYQLNGIEFIKHFFNI